jgi:hypothetical protein
MSFQVGPVGTVSADAFAYRCDAAGAAGAVTRVHRQGNTGHTFIEIGLAATAHPLIAGLSLPMFSEETSSPTARNFYTASYRNLYQTYLTTSPDNRHWHEIIVGGQPCMPYYDIDITGPSKPDVKTLLTTLHQLHQLIGRLLVPESGKTLQFFECESSNTTKISIHGVVRGCPAFVNSENCGQFVRSLESLAMSERAACLFRPDKTGNIKFVLDPNVYGRNKSMRMVGSSKYGEKRYLVPTTIERYAETLVSAAKTDGRMEFPHLRDLLNYMVQYVDADANVVRAVMTEERRNVPDHGVGTSDPLERLLATLRTTLSGHLGTAITFAAERVFTRGDGRLRIETRSTYCPFTKRAHNNHQYILVNLDTNRCSFRCWRAGCRRTMDGSQQELVFYLPCEYDADLSEMYDLTATTKRQKTSDPPYQEWKFSDWDAPFETLHHAATAATATTATTTTTTAPTQTTPALTLTLATATGYRAIRVPHLNLTAVFEAATNGSQYRI